MRPFFFYISSVQVVHQEIISRYFQCIGYLYKGFQAHAFNAALDVAEVGGGLIDHLRKSTSRDSLTFPNGSDVMLTPVRSSQSNRGLHSKVPVPA